MNLDDLQEASFRGAKFLIDTTSTSGGRKSVTHEYPNTDRRFVEDLGELREVYTVTGVVHGTNYFADRDNLIEQLKAAGSGELVHPFFGSVTVFARPYGLSQNLNELGVARFSMTFERTDISTFPKVATNNKSIIDQIANNSIESLGVDFVDQFFVTTNIPSNFTDAKNKLTSLTDSLQIIPDTALKITEVSNEYGAALRSFTDDINLLIAVPLALVGNLKGTLGAFGELGRTAQDKLDLLTSLFDFGDDDTVILQTTTARVERERNRIAVNSYVQANSLAQAYNNITSLSFETDSEIQLVQQTLDEQFAKVINDGNLSSDTTTQIKNLRVEVGKFLDQESANAFRVSTIQTYQIPITILTYQYYGNVSRTQQLIDLNNTSDPSYIEGAVKVLV